MQKNTISGKMELQILARQEADGKWSLGDEKPVSLLEESLTEGPMIGEGNLVLVDLKEDGTIISAEEAQDWVLGLVNQFLGNNTASSGSMEAEKTKIEEWRQELTLKNQDLTRRLLEIETREEQMQELEESFKREKEELESKYLDDE
ncbi:MAG: hypothetical protein WA896_22950 [Spirulinaceae cyanobacterium]